MLASTLTEFRDYIHAQLCYQLFITPIHLPVEKPYREFLHVVLASFSWKTELRSFTVFIHVIMSFITLLLMTTQQPKKYSLPMVGCRGQLTWLA